MPYLEYTTMRPGTNWGRRVRVSWDEGNKSPRVYVQEAEPLWREQYQAWKQKHRGQIIGVPSRWPKGCHRMTLERESSGNVPKSVVKDLLAWIRGIDLLAPHKAEHWVTCAPTTRIEWPLNDRVQAYLDYYWGVQPQDQRVVEFERRLDDIAKRYARNLTEWLWDDREYRF